MLHLGLAFQYFRKKGNNKGKMNGDSFIFLPKMVTDRKLFQINGSLREFDNPSTPAVCTPEHLLLYHRVPFRAQRGAFLAMATNRRVLNEWDRVPAAFSGWVEISTVSSIFCRTMACTDLSKHLTQWNIKGVRFREAKWFAPSHTAGGEQSQVPSCPELFLWHNSLLLVSLCNEGKQKFRSLMQLYLTYKLDTFPGSSMFLKFI